MAAATSQGKVVCVFGSPLRWPSLGLALAAGALSGCLTIQLDFQRLPASEALDTIEPGRTTRSEVLARLGPPEELRRPAPFERARFTSPQGRRIAEAGEIYGDDAYTYASGRRTLDNVGLLPVGLAILRVSWRSFREDRWRIEFDGNGVVSSVSRVEEIGDDTP
jgi:hypothetical protein